MADYIEWGNKRYSEIPLQDLPQSEGVFLCRTNDSDDPFTDWDYAVGSVIGCKPRALGLFKKIEDARTFAEAL